MMSTKQILTPCRLPRFRWRSQARRLAQMAATVLVTFAAVVSALSADKKPNILVIFGDDIGYWNVGAYTHGMMGRTPNIDRIAKEGMLFTDHYGQPSCTAG